MLGKAKAIYKIYFALPTIITALKPLPAGGRHSMAEKIPKDGSSDYLLTQLTQIVVRLSFSCIAGVVGCGMCLNLLGSTITDGFSNHKPISGLQR